jgi:hypothetical protein
MVNKMSKKEEKKRSCDDDANNNKNLFSEKIPLTFQFSPHDPFSLSILCT